MSLSQRSHSAAPSDNYHSGVGSGHSGHSGPGYGYRSSSPRRGSLSPPDDRYVDYPVLPIHGSPNSAAYPGGGGSSAAAAAAAAQASQQQRFQSRSATATPTGSPKKRQLPQVCIAIKSVEYLRYMYVYSYDRRCHRPHAAPCCAIDWARTLTSAWPRAPVSVAIGHVSHITRRPTVAPAWVAGSVIIRVCRTAICSQWTPECGPGARCPPTRTLWASSVTPTWSRWSV